MLGARTMKMLLLSLISLAVIVSSTPAKADPWASPASCAAALKARRVLDLPAGVVRVATWNLDGFPGPLPGAPPRGPARDTAWLACTLASLQADVVALQGVGTGQAADAALRQVTAALGRHTRSSWAVKLDGCTGKGRTRVGLLWNTRRLKARGVTVEGLMNPHRRACHQGERPGVRAYLRAPGGLDFHLISVHLPEGAQAEAARLRQKVLGQLKDVYDAAQRIEHDADLLLAGVFETVGCPGCSDGRTSATALTQMVQRLAATDPPFRVLPSNLDCTRLSGGEGALVSQLVSTRGFEEIARSGVRVGGLCAQRLCARPDKGAPLAAAATRLSRHCPLTVDIPDRDQDPKREDLGRFIEGSQGGGGAKAGALPQKLSPDQIRAVLGRLKPALRRACGREGSAALTVTIEGATGKVIEVTAPKGTKPCALKVMRKATFPRFQISAIEIQVPVVW